MTAPAAEGSSVESSSEAAASFRPNGGRENRSGYPRRERADSPRPESGRTEGLSSEGGPAPKPQSAPAEKIEATEVKDKPLYSKIDLD